jgi:hypothetical protein
MKTQDVLHIFHEAPPFLLSGHHKKEQLWRDSLPTAFVCMKEGQVSSLGIK